MAEKQQRPLLLLVLLQWPLRLKNAIEHLCLNQGMLIVLLFKCAQLKRPCRMHTAVPCITHAKDLMRQLAQAYFNPSEQSRLGNGEHGKMVI